MENSNLLLVYLSLLLTLLGVVALLILRQVFKTRRIEQTLNRLQAKLTKSKGTAQEYFELGSLLLDKKLYTQASLYLQQSLKALEEDETDNATLIYNALGFIYFAQEQYDLAIRNYKEALKIDPNYVIALNNLANSYEKKQLTQQALEMYQKVLEIEPKNSIAKRRAESLKKRLVPSS